MLPPTVHVISSSYNKHILAHTEPLLKDIGLLKVGDIFKLRLLKFYYKLMSNELPSYFMTYVPIITNKAYILNHDYALRTGARPAIRSPRIRHVFAKSTVLYTLIKLLNSLYLHKPNIMSAIQNGTHSYFGICFYSKQIFLQQYTYTCNILNCYTCSILIDKCVTTLYGFILNPIQKYYGYIIICISLLFLNTLYIPPTELYEYCIISLSTISYYYKQCMYCTDS